MALFDRFKKKTKKEEVQKIEKEKPEEKTEKEESKKEEVKKMRPLADQKKIPQAYRVIREPHITEKATFLIDQNKYVFKISPEANKVEIKKTVEALYGVKVEKVNLIHMAPKKRRLGRTEGWRHGLKKGFKKAIITLAKGEKIELLPK
jgi:large subunit ribosomal protein L23